MSKENFDMKKYIQESEQKMIKAKEEFYGAFLEYILLRELCGNNEVKDKDGRCTFDE